MSKTILSDPRVLECELADDSDYKYNVYLKEGFCWGNGRMKGYRGCFFHTVADFLDDAKYIKTCDKER